MEKVIFDCDNTFGLLHRDVDDGLTLLYLLGMPKVDLLGVTLSQGNGSRQEVIEATKIMKRQLNLSFDYYCKKESESELESGAVNFLMEQVKKYPHQITIIATGALTNLYYAGLCYQDFFRQIKQIILMGGTTKPLRVNRIPVSELNFSGDVPACRSVLLSSGKLAIMNGHLTAQAFFSRKEKENLCRQLKNRIAEQNLNYLSGTLENWLTWNQANFHFDGFCNWDITTAVYLEHPELFSQETYYLSENQGNLEKGQLELSDDSAYFVTMPKHLVDLEAFNDLLIKRMVRGLLL